MDQLIDEDSSSSTGSRGVEFEKSEKTEQKRADGNLIESEPDEGELSNFPRHEHGNTLLKKFTMVRIIRHI
jgi:hypothetical protein